MAGDWVAMRFELPDDPAVAQIAARLNLEPDAVVGKLLRIWAWAGGHLHMDGNAPGVTEAFLDLRVNCPGFARAMSKTKPEPWLIIRKNGIVFPHFDHWNTSTAKTRLLGNRRVNTHRQKKCNADVTLSALQKRDHRDRDRDSAVSALHCTERRNGQSAGGKDGERGENRAGKHGAERSSAPLTAAEGLNGHAGHANGHAVNTGEAESGTDSTGSGCEMGISHERAQQRAEVNGHAHNAYNDVDDRAKAKADAWRAEQAAPLAWADLNLRDRLERLIRGTHCDRSFAEQIRKAFARDLDPEPAIVEALERTIEAGIAESLTGPVNNPGGFTRAELERRGFTFWRREKRPAVTA